MADPPTQKITIIDDVKTVPFKQRTAEERYHILVGFTKYARDFNELIEAENDKTSILNFSSLPELKIYNVLQSLEWYARWVIEPDTSRERILDNMQCIAVHDESSDQSSDRTQKTIELNKSDNHAQRIGGGTSVLNNTFIYGNGAGDTEQYINPLDITYLGVNNTNKSKNIYATSTSPIVAGGRIAIYGGEDHKFVNARDLFYVGSCESCHKGGKTVKEKVMEQIKKYKGEDKQKGALSFPWPINTNKGILATGDKINIKGWKCSDLSFTIDNLMPLINLLKTMPPLQHLINYPPQRIQINDSHPYENKSADDTQKTPDEIRQLMEKSFHTTLPHSQAQLNFILHIMDLYDLFWQIAHEGLTKQLKEKLNHKIREHNLEINNKLSIQRHEEETFYKTAILSIVYELYPELWDRKFTFGNLDMFQKLTPTQLKRASQELERRRLESKARVENKCEHLRYVRQFRRETLTKTKGELLRVIKDLSSGVKGGWLQCRLCKLDMLCEHVAALHSCSSDNQNCMNKYIQQQHGNNSTKHHELHCKYCNEIIMEWDDVEKSKTIMDEDLRNILWGEGMSMMNQYVSDQLMNVPQFVSNLIQDIYEFVADIDKETLKSRTNTADEIKNKRKLYANIYLYAAITHVIIFNKKSLKPKKSSTGGTNNSASELLTYAVQSIIRTKNSMIAAVPQLSADYIKSKTISAYQQIAKLGPVKLLIPEQADIFITFAKYDPIVAYTALFNRPVKIKSKRSGGANVIDMLHDVLGRDPRKINDGSPYRTLKMPQMRDTPMHAAYAVFRDWLDAYQRATVFWSNNITTDWRKIMENLKKFEPIERKHIIKKYQRRWRFIGADKIPHDAANKSLEKVPLSYLYDVQGREHNWNIYISSNGDELTKKDAIQQLANGKKLPKFVNKRCSICNMLFTERDKIKDDVIRHILDENTIYENFDKMFGRQCPESGLIHEIVDQKCKYCGWRDVPAREQPEYYEKYKSWSPPRPPPLVETERKQQINVNAMKFKENLNIITLFSTKFEVPMINLTMMGNTEDLEYDKLQEDEKSSINVQNMKLKYYLQQLFVKYNNLRNISTTFKPPVWLKSFLENNGVAANYWVRFAELPMASEIIGNADEEGSNLDQIYAFARTMDIKKSNAYLLQHIVKFLTNMATYTIGSSWKEGASIMKLYSKYLLNDIIQKDKIESKAGRVNWNLFKDVLREEIKSIEDGTADVDQNYDENSAGITKEELDAMKDDSEDAGDVDSPFENEYDLDLEEGEEFENGDADDYDD